MSDGIGDALAAISGAAGELLQRGGLIWEEVRTKCANGPLPFVKFDPSSPGAVISFWDVAQSGDQARDLTLGLFYAELLVHRARGQCDDYEQRQGDFIGPEEAHETNSAKNQ